MHVRGPLATAGETEQATLKQCARVKTAHSPSYELNIDNMTSQNISTQVLSYLNIFILQFNPINPKLIMQILSTIQEEND